MKPGMKENTDQKQSWDYGVEELQSFDVDHMPFDDQILDSLLMVFFLFYCWDMLF